MCTCVHALGSQGGWSQVVSGVVTLGCLSPRPRLCAPVGACAPVCRCVCACVRLCVCTCVPIGGGVQWCVGGGCILFLLFSLLHPSFLYGRWVHPSFRWVGCLPLFLSLSVHSVCTVCTVVCAGGVPLGIVMCIVLLSLRISLFISLFISFYYRFSFRLSYRLSYLLV